MISTPAASASSKAFAKSGSVAAFHFHQVYCDAWDKQFLTTAGIFDVNYGLGALQVNNCNKAVWS